MFSHIVYYKVNPENPIAAQRIIEEARSMVSIMYGKGQLAWVEFSNELKAFQAARILRPARMVSSGEWDVVLNFVFRSNASCEEYMAHPLHIQFVRFVLRGWMIKGSAAEDPEEEFMKYILFAGPRAHEERWTRNYTIPDSEVVWAGEMVVDADDACAGA